MQQLAKERQQRQNGEKRERFWREKFNSQCLEIAEEDHDDLSQMFLNTGDQNVPTELGLSLGATETPSTMFKQKRLPVASKVSKQILLNQL